MTAVTAPPPTRKHRHRIRNLALFGLMIAFVLVAAFATHITYLRAVSLIHPRRWLPPQTPDSYDVAQWEEVTFESSDGLNLVAWFMPPAPAVDGATLVFAHGFGSNRVGMLQQAAWLHNAYGYGALLYDSRNHGGSEGTVTTMGLYETRDVEGAVAYLQSRDDVNPERIALLGESLGAATILLAAPDIPDVKAVIAQSTFTSIEDNVAEGVRTFTGLPPFPFAPMVVFFAEREAGASIAQVRPVDEIADIAPRPVLILHGSEDGLFDPINAQRLYDAAREPKQLVIFKGASHGGLYSRNPDLYEDTVIPFLETYLLTDAPAQP